MSGQPSSTVSPATKQYERVEAGLPLRLGRAVVRCLPAGRMTAGRVVTRVCGLSGKEVIGSFSEPPIRFAARLAEFVDAQVFYNGVFEPAITSLIVEVLRPGHIFVDVGANTGYYSLRAASAVGPTGRVIAFEPDRNSLSRLRTNIALNPWCAIEIVPVALSDRNGTCQFRESSNGGANQGGGSLCGDGEQSIVVQTVRLDHYVAQHAISAIDLVKIDVEGAEGSVLLGMAQSLRHRCIRRVVLEMHNQALESAGHSSGEIIESLERSGFVGFRIRQTGTRGRQRYQATGCHRLESISAADLKAPLAHFYFTRS